MALRNFNKRNSSRKSSNDELFNEITKLAYQFYIDRGYTHGNDMEDWLRAERIVRARYNID